MHCKSVDCYVGYGYTEEDSEKNLGIYCAFKDKKYISKFSCLNENRNKLKPWHPKKDTLHIHGVGYLTIKNNCIFINKEKYEIYHSLFKTLYFMFKDKIDFMGIVSIYFDLEEFFINNNIKFKELKSYDQIIPEDIYLKDNNDIKMVVTFNKYNLIIYKSNKVALKLNYEELYWTCTTEDVVDTIYYISLLKEYDIEEIVNMI